MIIFGTDRFPMCDNNHQLLMRQGCKVGPVQLEVRPHPLIKKKTTGEVLRNVGVVNQDTSHMEQVNSLSPRLLDRLIPSGWELLFCISIGSITGMTI